MKISHTSKQDTDLWSGILNGDDQSFLELYKRYYQELYRYGMRISGDKDLTKDCIQDMYSSIWAKKDELGEVTYVRPYLYKYLSRLVYNGVRYGLKNRLPDKNLENHLNMVMSFEDSLISDETNLAQSERLTKAISQLTKQQKMVIKLKFFEGYDYEEIVSITGLKQKTAYNLIHEAINSLKRSLLVVLWLLINF